MGYSMATFSVAFLLDRDFGGKIRQASTQIAGKHPPWNLAPDFLFKTLDKPTSQAKIPPISGSLHCSLGRPTVIAPAYDFNPAVATPPRRETP